MVRSLSVLFLFAGFAGVGSTAERLGDHNFRDLWHTVQARRMLAEDATLAPLNLGVHVKDGIAYLWGPVPSVDLAFRAEARLRMMIELIDVRNNLEIAPNPFGPLHWEPDAPRILPDRLPPPLPGLPRLPEKARLLASAQP